MNAQTSFVLSAALGAPRAAAAGPLRGIALVVQGAGIGALVGSLVVLRRERQRRRMVRSDPDHRWTIVARWAVATAAILAAAAVVSRLLQA